MVYLKAMNRLKKFWTAFLTFLPIGAGASTLLVASVAGVVGIAGFSIYRSSVPVDMSESLQFFSSCWTCQMFSDIMMTMSNILPRVYSAIGSVIIPFAIILSAVWFAWTLTSNFIESKMASPWSLTQDFTTRMIKLAVVCGLLVIPVPRLVTQIALEPIFNVGLSLNRTVAHDDDFDRCVIATAIADPTSIDAAAADSGAFSPRLRHNLACELAGVHDVTGLGMTVGWSMMNMAFDSDYMHKLMWDIPIFPNVFLLFGGMLILALYVMALMPVAVYFLEIFIKLSLDMVMLPLMLLGWLFKGWKISLPGAGKTIRTIIDNVINGTLGLSVTCIMIAFSIMFLHAVFGDWLGAPALTTALTQNDSKFLMDALMLRNDSLVTVVLMGIFIAMFMTMIPTLAKTLFKVQISTEFYDSAKANTKIIWENLKKWYEQIKK